MRFHTHLPVRDIDETLGFYTKLLGVAPVKRKPDYVKFLTSELNIAFSNAGAMAPVADVHLGFEVESSEALTEIRQRLAGSGLRIEDHETTVCCYASQDKFWVTDPNGYRWEIYRYIEEADQFIDPSSSCCESARTEEPGC